MNFLVCLDVRAAAIDSCYDISCCHDVFQSKLVEYIVSMFDDDIEHVRLQAMRILGKIAQGRVLRGEQVLSILTELLVRCQEERGVAYVALLCSLEPLVRYSLGAA